MGDILCNFVVLKYKYMARNDELTYKRWKGMKSRCYSPSFNNQQNKYQKLGIVVCEEWKNSYEQFKKDMGECLEGYSLERIDPLGNYEPNNCIWIKKEEQPKNRTNTLYYKLGDEIKNLKDWAKEFKIPYSTLRHRVLVQNMSLEEALKFTKLVFYNEEYKTVKEWCNILNISYTAVVTKKKRTNLSYPQIFDMYIK